MKWTRYFPVSRMLAIVALYVRVYLFLSPCVVPDSGIPVFNPPTPPQPLIVLFRALNPEHFAFFQFPVTLVALWWSGKYGKQLTRSAFLRTTATLMLLVFHSTQMGSSFCTRNASFVLNSHVRSTAPGAAVPVSTLS